MREAGHHATLNPCAKPSPLAVCAAFALCAFALIATTAFSTLAFPARAFAEGGAYGIEEMSTEVVVEQDGSISVTERQTLSFEDRNDGVVWYLHAPESGESVRVSSVRVAPVDTGGTMLDDWKRLQMIDADPRRQGTSPGDTAVPALRAKGDKQPWYSYRIADGMVRACFPVGPYAKPAASSRTYVVETSYTVEHRMRVFRDVAELYWRYADDNLPVDANNVSLQVKIPLPADIDPATASQEITAWGHGPDKGTFAIGEDGTVTYLADRISKGNYAEAHLIFPASWLTQVPEGAAHRYSELRRASALSEESSWVDIYQREEAWDNKVRVLFLGIAVVVLAFGIVGVIRNRRSPRARRALMRTAATMGIVALGANLFFKEPLTTVMLAGFAVALACIGLALPSKPEPESEGE